MQRHFSYENSVLYRENNRPELEADKIPIGWPMR